MAPKGRNPLKPRKAGKTLNEVADDTLEILRGAGGYHVDTGEGGQRYVNISQAQTAAVQGTSYHPDPVPPAADERPSCNFMFEAATSFAAAEPRSRAGRRVCVLNFASGNHPGGGWKTGARAQEEQLCRASGLFPTLTRHSGFYGRPPKGFHTDRMIYSPQVPVFRSDDLALLAEPFLVDIVTAAAVNRKGVRRRDLEKVDGAMQRRVLKLLSLCQASGAEVIVLGAWGTGVFGLDPDWVAAWFRDALAVIYFEEVVFALPDAYNLEVFQDVFQEPPEPIDQRSLRGLAPVVADLDGTVQASESESPEDEEEHDS